MLRRFAVRGFERWRGDPLGLVTEKRIASRSIRKYRETQTDGQTKRDFHAVIHLRKLLPTLYLIGSEMYFTVTCSKLAPKLTELMGLKSQRMQSSTL